MTLMRFDLNTKKLEIKSRIETTKKALGADGDLLMLPVRYIKHFNPPDNNNSLAFYFMT